MLLAEDGHANEVIARSAGPDAAGSDTTGSDTARSDAGKSEVGKSELGKLELGKKASAKAKPKPSRAAVLKRDDGGAEPSPEVSSRKSLDVDSSGHAESSSGAKSPTTEVGSVSRRVDSPKGVVRAKEVATSTLRQHAPKTAPNSNGQAVPRSKPAPSKSRNGSGKGAPARPRRTPQDQAIALQVEPRPQPRRRRVLRFSTSFVTSTMVHIALLVLLAICTISLPILDIFTVESAPWQPDDETQMLELSPDNGGAASQSSSADADSDKPFRIDPRRMSDLGMLASMQQLNGNVGEGYSGPVNDVRNLPGSLDNQLNVRLRGDGDSSGTADFFGIEARGNSFVYVVDCSNSMAGRRWERALYELRRSVEGLDADQEFYVVFFDSRAHAMFGEKIDELKMRAASDANRLRFRRWLGSVKLGNWTRPMESMQFALSLQPDAIYLLSDGEFQDDTVSYLEVANPNPEGRQQGLESIPIHTVCFESPIGQEQLGTIARDSGGTFRFVP